MVLVPFAFLAGVVTIASPCILPLLPLILSGSAGTGRARPYGIVAGFVVTFSAATLTFALLVQATGIPTETLRWVAVVVLAAFGVVMLVPRFLARFEGLASRVAAAGHRIGTTGSVHAPGADTSSGLAGGLLMGVTLGLVWTPCVGPIMASVITLAATGSLSGMTVGITLAYALGTAGPMLLIIIGGKAVLRRVAAARNAGAIVQRVFASLMIVVAAAIAFNLDRQFQGAVLDAFPGLEQGITAIERNRVVEEELDRLRR